MKIKGLRWYMAGLICLVTALNYLDRNTLPLLAQTLERELGITADKYAEITTAFLIGYMIMYAVSGRVIDFLGSRRGFAVFVFGWAVVDTVHYFARSALQFMGCRFLLGAVEPANFPAAVKVVSEWFPVRERALAVGIFNSGTALGAAFAAPIVTWVVLNFGWRYTFVVSAALSALWVLVWLLVYRVPQQHPCITEAELKLIEENQPVKTVEERVSTGRILRTKEAWGCIVARMLTDPISYFIIFWLPKFLQQERHFDLAAMARYYWMPWVGLALGNLVGGAIPKYLVQHGWTLNRARKTMMFIASLIMPASFILITQVATPLLTITCATTGLFFHGVWANVTLPAEVFQKSVVGSVSGFGGAGGSLIGAILNQLVIGKMVKAGLFPQVFMLYSILPMTAFIVVCLLVKRLGELREIPAWPRSKSVN
jgi:ACS family hexuronate transporter-like MFS transporter